MSKPFFSTACMPSCLILLQHQPLPMRALVQLRQFVRLGFLQKAPKHPRVDGELPVKIAGLADVVAVIMQMGFDAGFKSRFIGLAGHGCFSFNKERITSSGMRIIGSLAVTIQHLANGCNEIISLDNRFFSILWLDFIAGIIG